MKRRFLPFAIALGLAALAVAIAPWTVSTSAMVARIDGQIQSAFGLDLDVKGRSTIAFLPVPRVKFENFTLRSAEGVPVVVGRLGRHAPSIERGREREMTTAPVTNLPQMNR